jgi:hypothetical protein
MTLDEIVSDYIREYRDDARAERRFFEILRSPLRPSERPHYVNYPAASGTRISGASRKLCSNRLRPASKRSDASLPKLRLPRASARGGTEVPIGRNAGGQGEAGMESEEGTAF